MRRIFLVLFFIPSLLLSQTAVEKENHAAGATGMDKEYYEFYFETIPDLKRTEKTKLEFNLVRTLKNEILRRERKTGADYLAGIKPETISYAAVTPDSIWVRGIKDVFKFIKYTEYMYVVKYDRFRLFVSYTMNPSLYMQDPFQAELIYKRENIFLANPTMDKGNDATAEK